MDSVALFPFLHDVLDHATLHNAASFLASLTLPLLFAVSLPRSLISGVVEVSSLLQHHRTFELFFSFRRNFFPSNAPGTWKAFLLLVPLSRPNFLTLRD